MTKDSHDRVKDAKDDKTQETKLAPGNASEDLKATKSQAQATREARAIGATPSSKVVKEQLGELKIDFKDIAGKDGKVTAQEIEQYEKKHKKDISADEKAALDYLKTHMKEISGADGTADKVGGKDAFTMYDLRKVESESARAEAEIQTAKHVKEAAKTHDLSKVIKDINDAATNPNLDSAGFEKYVKAVTEQLHDAGILPKEMRVRPEIYKNTGIPDRTTTLAVEKTDGHGATLYDAKGKDTLKSEDYSDLFASKKTQAAESKADMADNVREQGKAHFKDIDKDGDGQLSLDELKAYKKAQGDNFHPEYSNPDKAVDDMIAHFDEIKGQKWDGRKGITEKDLEAYSKQTGKKHEKAERRDERAEKKSESASAEAKAASKPESKGEAKPEADSAAAKPSDAQKPTAEKAEPADDILDKKRAGILDPFAEKHSETEVWVEVGSKDNPDKTLDKFATAAFVRANGRKPSEAELTQQRSEIIKDNPDAFPGGKVPKKFPEDTDIRVEIPKPRPKANTSLD